MICGSGGRKVGSLKRRVRSQLAGWEMKNCTPLWREAHFQVKMHKTHHVRTTFGSWDVEKVHAIVARSTFPSQNMSKCTKHTSSGPLLARCRKSARRCGAKHISKSKCTKHTTFGPLLEVEMSKKRTPLWREAHFEVKMFKALGVRTTFGSWDVEKVHAVVARSTFRSQNMSKCTKHTSSGPLLALEMSKKRTPLWREAHFQVKMYKTHHVRTTFGSWDVEKVHAVVARSTFRSQNVQSTRGSDHFWRLRCRKSARRCGAKHISKSKCSKHTTFGPLLEVQMSLRFTTLHYTTLHSTTLQDITLHYTPVHYITLHYTPVHSTTLNYTTPHYITLHYAPLHYTILHYTTSHYTTLHYTILHYLPLHFTTLHYTTLHYITTTTTTTQLHSTTLHYTKLHYTTLHYIPPHSTTPHYITLHYITLYIPPHSTTPHYITLHYITLNDTAPQIDR